MVPAAIQQYCQDNTCEMTAIRQVVLEHLWESPKPAKAYDMIDVLRDKGVGAPKPATVYRTLDYLSGFGLVHKVHALNAYIPCHHPGRHRGCQLLICQRCNSVEEFCDAELASSIPQKAKALGFEPEYAVVEVFGTCVQCQPQP